MRRARICSLVLIAMFLGVSVVRAQGCDVSVRRPVYVLSNAFAPALNVGVDVPTGKDWSVSASYYYPWIWPSSSNRWCFEALALDLGVTRWFGGENGQKGIHGVGAYAMGGYYDLGRNYKGHQGEFVNAGLCYSYRRAVGSQGWKVEFSVGLGVFLSGARPYYVKVDGGPLLEREGLERRVRYYGPSRFGVTFLCPLRRKEGSR